MSTKVEGITKFNSYPEANNIIKLFDRETGELINECLTTSRGTFSMDVTSGSGIYYVTATRASTGETKIYDMILRDVVVLFSFSSIDVTADHTVAVKSDGTCLATGENDYGQCNVGDWTDIVQVSVGISTSVGLKSDGTVEEAGKVSTDVYYWENIKQIHVSFGHVVGIKSDGTCVAAGDNDYGQCNVGDWTDIVQVCVEQDVTLGLKANGTVVGVGQDDPLHPDYTGSQLDVENWTDVVFISTSGYSSYGVKSDGTVVGVGRDNYGQVTDMLEWTDIVQIACGRMHTVGLKSDGTCVAVGRDEDFCNVDNWTDIVFIAAFGWNTIGIKSDGTVLVVGDNTYGQVTGVENWTDIKTP